MIRRVFLTLVCTLVCANAAWAQCAFTNQLTCPATLLVGETGSCTLVSRNAGSAACTGFVYNGMIGYDDSGSANLVRFSGASSSQLPVCFDSGSFPEVPGFYISYAYCFSDFGDLPPGGTMTTTANVQLLSEPPSGVVQVAGISGAFDESSEFGAESEPSIVTIVAGAAGCNTPRAPAAYVPSSATQQQPYELRWLPLPGVSSYDVEESNNPEFSNASRSRVLGTSAPFTRGAGTFYYRVRGIADCNQSIGPFSTTVRTVVTALPPANSTLFDLPVPIGSELPITFSLFVRSPEQTSKNALDVPFTATTSKAWLTVVPSAGTLPPTGTTLTVTANPKDLPPGASTGTVSVTNPSTGQPIQNTPVSVSLVGPVTQAGKSAPPPNTLIIPVVAKVDGASSRFQSDVRLTNVGRQAVTYRLAFTPSGQDGRQVGSQTSFSINAEETVALNDVLKNSFGVGAVAGETAGGSLEIRPLGEIIGVPGGGEPQEPSLVASSRTYAVTADGTLGQFIPAVPFSEFVGPGAVLSIQQIAESTAYRTNVGFVEGSGEPASIAIRVLRADGQQLGEFPFTLKPFEHRQINRFLSSNGINNVTDGRLEVRVTSPTGRVTAYASVLDNKTDDPLLVSPVQPALIMANRYIIPGAADINNPLASWRTDIRIYNAGSVPLGMTLTYYPQEAPTSPRSAEVTVQPGQVRSIDNTLQSLYGLMNSGGSIVVASNFSAPFVVTARTYNQTANGTYGQFVPAVTPEEGTGIGERPLQVLQLEQSSPQQASGYRTNVGIFELSGNAATARIEVLVPDSKVALTREVPLLPNQFVQIPLRDLLGGGSASTYNVRVSVKVIGGSGRVGAYGSVIDGKTQDPTYIPAQ